MACSVIPNAREYGCTLYAATNCPPGSGLFPTSPSTPGAIVVQDTTDPCACDLDSVVDGNSNSESLNHPGCDPNEWYNGKHFCYTKLECGGAEDGDYDDDYYFYAGMEWRYCDPEVDSNTWLCQSCDAGFYGEGYRDFCLKCPAGTFMSTTGATKCTDCPADRPDSLSGATAEIQCRNTLECDSVKIEGCVDTTHAVVTGDYVPYFGYKCDGTSAAEGFPVYRRQISTEGNVLGVPYMTENNYYLYYLSELNRWAISDFCGHDSEHEATGVAGGVPFMNTDDEWMCWNGRDDVGNSLYTTGQMTITCDWDAVAAPCGIGEYGAGGSDCTSCPRSLPLSSAGATSIDQCVQDPEDCVQVTMAGCAGTLLEDFVNGAFELFDGDCGDGTGGRPAYARTHLAVNMYLYFIVEYGVWATSDACGSRDVQFSAGLAGELPFLSPADTWSCNNYDVDLLTLPQNISCSRYLCEPGSGSLTGGECSNCPPGTYGDGTTPCTSCVAGYNPSAGSVSADDCRACPHGSASTIIGAVDAESCGICPSGTYAKDGEPCAPCPPATFNPNQNSTSPDSCLACPEGTTSLSASSSEAACVNPNTVLRNIFVLSPQGISTFVDSELKTVFNGAPLDEAGSLTFVATDTILAASYGSGQVLEFKYDGALVGVFAAVAEAAGVLFLPDLSPPQVAVAGKQGVLFFDLADGLGDGELQEDEDAIARIDIPSRPFDLARRGDDQLLITTPVAVFLACVPGSACGESEPQLIHTHTSANVLPRIATISHDQFVLLVAGTALVCAITDVAECEVFAASEGRILTSVHYDPEQELVFVGDLLSLSVRALDLTGSLVASTFNPSIPTDLMFKSGNCAPLASVSPLTEASAVVTISLPITLHDRFNDPVTSISAYELSNFNLTAHGLVRVSDTLSLPHSFNGDFESSSASPSSLTATVDITYSGDWAFIIQENFKSEYSQLIGPSDFSVHVDAGPTHAPSSDVSFVPTLTAGDTFTATLSTVDVHGNPTSHDGGTFFAEINEKRIQLSRDSSDTLSFGARLTEAGPYFFSIEHSQTNLLAGSSQFGVQVSAASPDPTKCSHSLVDMVYFDPRRGKLLSLQVIPYDAFMNLATASDDDLKAVITGYTNEALVYPLLPPNYEQRIEFPIDTNVIVEIAFTYEGVSLPGTPKEITISLPPRLPFTAIIVGLSVATVLLLVLFASVYRRRVRSDKSKIDNARSSHRRSSDVARALASEKHILEIRNDDLQNSLRAKKHNEEELAVMLAALTDLSEARCDELRGVLIPSSEVKVERLLGKGAFGVVNLATYKGGQIAVKQLIRIEDESVTRFRFECFLMKSLRHPNIVKLIGVCWDDGMFGCCLEFIENGTLGDHLKSRDMRKLTWKANILKTATECAAGLEYLHGERFWDDKGGKWQEVIVHRDLKPDNILITDAWQVKLTDFGEARAVQENNTMTSVGTPIYIAPEVLRGDYYDSAVDVYSFGVLLVAMIRAEKDIIEFFYECLRKHMRKQGRQGIGMAILNYRLLNGWRPKLPEPFLRAYPLLSALIKKAWSGDAGERPSFAEISQMLAGEIRDEIRTREEPAIVLMGLEDDAIYQALDEDRVEEEAEGGGGEGKTREELELEVRERAQTFELAQQSWRAERENLMDELKSYRRRQAGGDTVERAVEGGEREEGTERTDVAQAPSECAADRLSTSQVQKDIAALMSMAGRN